MRANNEGTCGSNATDPTNYSYIPYSNLGAPPIVLHLYVSRAIPICNSRSMDLSMIQYCSLAHLGRMFPKSRGTTVRSHVLGHGAVVHLGRKFGKWRCATVGSDAGLGHGAVAHQ